MACWITRRWCLPGRSSERTSISSMIIEECGGNKGETLTTKQTMTVEVNSRESGECCVGSRARKEKGRIIVVVATKGTIVMEAGETTLNYFITGVAFGEIVLSGLGASMKTLSIMGILDEVGQLAATYS